MRIGNYVLRVRLITYMQTDDDCPYLHAEFAPMANNSEYVKEPVYMKTVEKHVKKRKNDSDSDSDSDSDADADQIVYMKTVEKHVKKRKRVVDSSDEVREVEC
jgi:hypothetical protein